ncbi:MAG TPA: LON peptidase substrate-binding domain-containing protein [Thermoleophilaceae bacterium]|nr:LON peptidase substrate-binding domain-containing protein [Thermoleophilaceae bacterium]
MAPKLERFPLFPLGLVLLPGEAVPLHIFEERYKLMVGRCLDERSEFGILWLSDDGLQEVGCTARIVQVLERFDDGRLSILVKGMTRFGLLRRIEDMPYPAGDVELLEDDPQAPDAGAATAARERYAEIVERVTDERPATEELAALDAYTMAASLEVAPEAKQQLLELRTEQERLERLSELLSETVDQLNRAEQAAERARSNGSVRG